MSAVLLLGGEEERDSFAAKLAFQEDIECPLLVFASSPGAGAEERLIAVQAAGKLVLSYEACDTVTNFSTMIPELQTAGIVHVLLVTSSYHMTRATAIAQIMLGSCRITFEAWPVGCRAGRAGKREPAWKIYRASWQRIGVNSSELCRLLTTPGSTKPILLFVRLGIFVVAFVNGCLIRAVGVILYHPFVSPWRKACVHGQYSYMLLLAAYPVSSCFVQCDWHRRARITRCTRYHGSDNVKT